MLALVPSTEPDALSEALAELVAILHPNAGMGFGGATLEAARHSLRNFLCDLRHHLHEHSLLLRALEESASRARLAPILAGHREARGLSGELCERLRDEDLRGARGLAQALRAKLLDHGTQERHLWTIALCDLDPAQTRRLSDRLFRSMQGDMVARHRSAPDRGALADLHSFYVRQIQQLQGRRMDPQPAEADHEHSCRG